MNQEHPKHDEKQGDMGKDKDKQSQGAQPHGSSAQHRNPTPERPNPGGETRSQGQQPGKGNEGDRHPNQSTSSQGRSQEQGKHGDHSGHKH